MPILNEEEPEEPDEPREPGTDVPTLSAPVVSAVSSGGREYEYRTELLTLDQVTDGRTLADQLTAASADGWDLVEIVDAGERRALLLRKPKRKEQDRRPVGFARSRPS
jgi:hypothetical protein